MSTTPSGEPPTSETTPTRPQRPSFGFIGSTGDLARLPIPGNAELLVYILAQVVAWIVVYPADHLTVNDYFTFFTFTTVAYLLSRGIAKASRVLEQ